MRVYVNESWYAFWRKLMQQTCTSTLLSLCCDAPSAEADCLSFMQRRCTSDDPKLGPRWLCQLGGENERPCGKMDKENSVDLKQGNLKAGIWRVFEFACEGFVQLDRRKQRQY